MQGQQTQPDGDGGDDRRGADRARPSRRAVDSEDDHPEGGQRDTEHLVDGEQPSRPPRTETAA